MEIGASNMITSSVRSILDDKKGINKKTVQTYMNGVIRLFFSIKNE